MLLSAYLSKRSLDKSFRHFQRTRLVAVKKWRELKVYFFGACTAVLAPVSFVHRSRRRYDVSAKGPYYATVRTQNVQSITSYFTASQKQQLNMSYALNGRCLGAIDLHSGSSIAEKRKLEFKELTYSTFRPTYSLRSKWTHLINRPLF